MSDQNVTAVIPALLDTEYDMLQAIQLAPHHRLSLYDLPAHLLRNGSDAALATIEALVTAGCLRPVVAKPHGAAYEAIAPRADMIYGDRGEDGSWAVYAGLGDEIACEVVVQTKREALRWADWVANANGLTQVGTTVEYR